MSMPSCKLKVAKEWRKKSKGLDFLRYPNLNKIQTFFKDA